MCEDLTLPDKSKNSSEVASNADSLKVGDSKLTSQRSELGRTYKKVDSRDATLKILRKIYSFFRILNITVWYYFFPFSVFLGSYMAPFIIIRQKAQDDFKLYVYCNSIPSSSPEFTSMCNTDFLRGYIPPGAGKQDVQPASQTTPEDEGNTSATSTSITQPSEQPAAIEEATPPATTITKDQGTG